MDKVEFMRKFNEQWNELRIQQQQAVADDVYDIFDDAGLTNPKHDKIINMVDGVHDELDIMTEKIQEKLKAINEELS